MSVRNGMSSVRNGLTAAAAANYVKAPAQRAWIREDFLAGAGIATVLNTGGGLGQISGDGTRVGILNEFVQAAGADGVRTMLGNSGQAIVLFGGGAAHFEGSAKVLALSNGVDNIVARIGLGDPATGLVDAVDGIYYEYDFGTYGDHKWRLCTSSNSVRTKVDTGILATAGGVGINYQRFEIVVNAAGTLVNGFINGVACANTIATNIPTGAGRYTQVCAWCTKQLGAGALNFSVDYLDFYVDFNPAR